MVFQKGFSRAMAGFYPIAPAKAIAQARSALAAASGVELIEDFTDNRFPMPTDVTGRDPVAVGRIRQDLSDPNALELWLCGDQIRKGAALNAVQIAELLMEAK